LASPAVAFLAKVAARAEKLGRRRLALVADGYALRTAPWLDDESVWTQLVRSVTKNSGVVEMMLPLDSERNFYRRIRP
jgi:hypothetical protein